MARLNMRELGRKLGVDRSTISRALNPEKAHLVAPATRERIRDEATRSGYAPDHTARALRRGRTDTVGILVPDLDNETLVRVTRQIMLALEPSDESSPLTPFIAETLDKPDKTAGLLRAFRLRRVDAIIALSATELDLQALQETAADIPVILAVRSLSGGAFPSSLCDDGFGGAVVAEYLASRGHRIVCQLRGPQSAATFKNRALGFSRVCRTRGLIETPTDIEARLATSLEAKSALGSIMAVPQRPTAVFAHNDALALGLMESMREWGLDCPRDLAVVGFNNTELGRVLATPLTTVDYPVAEVAAHAGLLLRKLIGNPRASWESKTFRPALVVRASA